jgi:hypothetical protein
VLPIEVDILKAVVEQVLRQRLDPKEPGITNILMDEIEDDYAQQLKELEKRKYLGPAEGY